MHLLHTLVDSLLALVPNLIPRQSEAKVVGSQLQHLFNVLLTGVVQLVQTQVKVLELGIHKQKPIGDFLACLVFALLGFEDVEQGHGLLWLLARFQLFVFFDNCVALLHFLLVGGHVSRREGLAAEAFEQGLHSRSCEV